MRRVAARLLFVLVLPIASAGTHAAIPPEVSSVRPSLVRVVVMEDDRARRAGSGFAVGQGYVLTAAHLVAGEDRIAAVPLATGAEFVARLVYANERADLAVLAVAGLTAPPLRLAADGFEPGRPVYSAGAWDASGQALGPAPDDAVVPVAEGSVGRHVDLSGRDGFPVVPLMEHNAMIPAAGYGGPVLNECGEVAGLNRGSPDVSAWRLRRGLAPEGVVHALRAAAVAALLDAQAIASVTSESSCVSALAAARAEAAETAERLEQTRQEMETLSGEAAETRQQLERTQVDRDEAAARAADAESRVAELESEYEEAVRRGEEAETLQTALETARAEQDTARAVADSLEGEVATLEQRLRDEAAADRTRLIALAAVSGAVLLLVVGVAIVAVRRRSRQLALAREEAAQAERVAAEARAEAEPEPVHADCVLVGNTGDGRAVSLKVPGSLLGGEGAVVGRSPRNSTLLIDDRTLSREHARLFNKADEIYVDDLGSTNGTRLNGRPLQAGAPTAVQHGDTLEFGSVKVELIVADD